MRTKAGDGGVHVQHLFKDMGAALMNHFCDQCTDRKLHYFITDSNLLLRTHRSIQEYHLLIQEPNNPSFDLLRRWIKLMIARLAAS
jgi:hypothetical protein